MIDENIFQFFEKYIVPIPNYMNEERIKTCYMLWKGKSNFYYNLLKILNYLNEKGSTTSLELEEKILEWILEDKPNAKRESRFPSDIINYLITYGLIKREKGRISNSLISTEVLRNPSEKSILSILMNKITGFEFFLNCEDRVYDINELKDFWIDEYLNAYENNESYRIENKEYFQKQFKRRLKWLLGLNSVKQTNKKYIIHRENWPKYKTQENVVPIEEEYSKNIYNRSNNQGFGSKIPKAFNKIIDKSYKPNYITSLLDAYLIYNSFKNIQPGKVDLVSLSKLFKYIITRYWEKDSFQVNEIAQNFDFIRRSNFKKPKNIVYGMLEFLDKFSLIVRYGKHYFIKRDNEFLPKFFELINSDDKTKFEKCFKEYLKKQIFKIRFFQVLIKFKNCSSALIAAHLGSEMEYWTTKMLILNSLLEKPINQLINTKSKNVGVKKPFNIVVVSLALKILNQLDLVNISDGIFSLNQEFSNKELFKEKSDYISFDNSIIPFHFQIIIFDFLENCKSKKIYYSLSDTNYQREIFNFKKCFEEKNVELNNIESIDNVKAPEEVLSIIAEHNYRNFILSKDQFIMFNFKHNNIYGCYLTNLSNEIKLNETPFKVSKILTMYLNPDTNGVFHCVCSKSILNENLFLKHIHNCIPFYNSLIGEKRLKLINFKELWEENKNGHYNCICGKAYTNRGFLLKHLIGCEQEISSIRLDDHKKNFELEEFSSGNKVKDYTAIENLLNKTNERNFHCFCEKKYLSARKTHILNHIKKCTVFNERLELYINNYNNLNNIDLNKITLQYMEEQGFEINGRQLLYEIFDYCGSKFSELTDKDFTSIIPAKIEIIEPRNKVNALEVVQNNIDYKMIFSVPAKKPGLLYEILSKSIKKPGIESNEIYNVCKDNMQRSRYHQYFNYLIRNGFLNPINEDLLFITKTGRDLFKSIKENENRVFKIYALSFLPYLGYLNYLKNNGYESYGYFNGDNSILKQYLINYKEKQEDIRIIFHYWDYKLGVARYQNRKIIEHRLDEILQEQLNIIKIVPEKIFYYEDINDYRNKEEIEIIKRIQKISLIISLIVAKERNTVINTSKFLKFFKPFKNISKPKFLDLIKCLKLNGLNIGIDEEQDVIFLKENIKFIITYNETINVLKQLYNFNDDPIVDFNETIFKYLNNNHIIVYNYDYDIDTRSSIHFDTAKRRFPQLNIEITNDDLTLWNNLEFLIYKPERDNDVLFNIFSISDLNENDDYRNFFNDPSLLLEKNLNEIEKLYFHEEIPYYGIVPLFINEVWDNNYTELGKIFKDLIEKESFERILCAFFFYFVPHFRIFIVILDLIRYPPTSDKFELDFYNRNILIYNQEILNLFKVIEYFLNNFGYDIIDENYYRDSEKIDNIIINIWNLSQNLNIITKRGNIIEPSEDFEKFFYREFKFNMRKHVKGFLKKELVTFIKNKLDLLREE